MNPHKTVVALLIGLSIGLAVGRQLSPSLWVHVFIGVLFSLVVYRTQDTVAPIVIMAVSLGAVALCLEISRAFFGARIQYLWLLALFVLLAVVITWLWRASPEDCLTWVDVLQTVMVVSLFLVVTRHHSWVVRDAFAAISESGEDNGTWLDGVARVIRRDAYFDSQEIVLGGTVGSVLASLFVGTAQYLAPATGTFLDTGLFLHKLYWLMTIFAVLVSARLAFRLTKEATGFYAVIPSCLSALATLLFARGLYTLGHLTALLAATMLGVALFVFMIRFAYRIVNGAIAVIASWTFANSWFALHGLLLIMGLGVLATFLLRRDRGKSLVAATVERTRSVIRTSTMKTLIVWGIPAVLLLVLFRYVLFPIFKILLDFEYLRFNLTLAGGYAVINPQLALLIILLSIALIAQMRLSPVRISLFGVTVLSAITLVVALIVYGFVQAPYTPQYAAYKSLHLVSMVLSPIAISGLTLLLGRILNSRSFAGFAVASLTLAGAVTFWEPYPTAATLSTEPKGAWFVDGAISELRKNPERQLLCLDTRFKGYDPYTGYLCTRLLAGMTGRTSDQTNMWAAASLCIQYSESYESFPDAFWDDVTIIVTDGGRLASTDSCDGFGWAGPNGEDDETRFPIGWTSNVPWKLVRVINSQGNEVPKTFKFLRGQENYTDEVIARLERTLID